MNKAVSLLVLVKSLSKSEKRFFKLYSRIQSGEKAYDALFNLMVENDVIDQIEERFKTDNPQLSFEVTVKHLNRIILDSLVHLRRNKDIQARLFNGVIQAEILFERGLIDESFNELRKTRKLAEFYENDAMILLIRRTELKYMSSIDFVGISEKQVVDKQIKINEVLRYIRSANQHSQLYDILKYRLTYK